MAKAFASRPEAEERDEDRRPDGLATGPGTASRNDVADPHPATEEDYDQIPNPGGTRLPDGPDIGPNSYVHDGSAPPRPHNKGAGPK